MFVDCPSVRLPVSRSDVPMTQVIAQAVVSDTGRIARVRLLRAPMVPVDEDILAERLIEAAAGCRLEPATLDGEPVPVYFSITLDVRGEAPG